MLVSFFLSFFFFQTAAEYSKRKENIFNELEFVSANVVWFSMLIIEHNIEVIFFITVLKSCLIHRYHFSPTRDHPCKEFNIFSFFSFSELFQSSPVPLFEHLLNFWLRSMDILRR